MRIEQIGVALVIALALLSAWLIISGTGDTEPTQTSHNSPPQTLVQYATQPSAAKGPMVANVITTATKLGQGKEAVAGEPTATNFDHPTLKETAAGTALVVPGSALPASNWVQQITALTPLTSGNRPRLKFDMYSWSMGTLAATTPGWIDLAENGASAVVPPMLLGHIQQLTQSERVMLVIAPNSDSGAGTSAYTAPLNPHDAYILIADVMVPTRPVIDK